MKKKKVQVLAMPTEEEKVLKIQQLMLDFNIFRKYMINCFGNESAVLQAGKKYKNYMIFVSEKNMLNTYFINFKVLESHADVIERNSRCGYKRTRLLWDLRKF